GGDAHAMEVEQYDKQPEILAAVKTVCQSAEAFGGVEVALEQFAKIEMVKSPIQQALALLTEAAKKAGISIAHFIDALQDAAMKKPEEPEEVDENDLPGYDQLASRFLTVNADTRAAKQIFAAQCRVVA